jgi:hypothetical protein
LTPHFIAFFVLPPRNNVFKGKKRKKEIQSDVIPSRRKKKKRNWGRGIYVIAKPSGKKNEKRKTNKQISLVRLKFHDVS